MAITSEIFDAYLKCPLKCWLQYFCKEGNGNIYADWVRSQNELYRINGTKQLLNCVTSEECATAQANLSNLKTAKWKFAVNFAVQKDNLESNIHIIERIPSEGRGRSAQFIPARFIFTNNISKDNKLLLAYDALVLSENLNRNINCGKIIHGDSHATVKVGTTNHAVTVRKLTSKIVTLLANDSPPEVAPIIETGV